MSIASLPRMSPAEYLRFERASDVRHEYLNGEIRDKVGGTSSHARIIMNFAFCLQLELRGKPYWIVTSDMRVGVSASSSYFYPDIVVTESEAVCDEGTDDIVINPILLVEVLSKSTTKYDRGEKFELYKGIPTFAEYVLIAQDHPFVEQHVRDSTGNWNKTDYEGLSEHFSLKTVPCGFPLAAIYDLVEF